MNRMVQERFIVTKSASACLIGRRGRLLPLFLMLLITACIVSVSQGSVTVSVPGYANPWLAGMPNGTTASTANRDSAPTNSPVQVTGLPLWNGANLTFSASGLTSNDPNDTLRGPDGDTAVFNTHFLSAEHGKSGLTAPLSSLVGVFLDNNQPTSSPAPASLDFTGNLSFSSFAPSLKQVFFVGNGLTSSGQVQHFVVPDGATRLFLGTMDGDQWWNNPGSLEVTVAPEPATLSLLALGGLLALRRRRGK
jgi:hypothetical protein